MATSQNVLHHNVLLSNYVQHWTPPKDVPWYLHDELFPIVPVTKAANSFKVINQATFMQTAPSAVGPRGDVGTVQAYYDPEGNYITTPYAQDGVIDHLERDEADDVALYEQLATDIPTTVLKNSLEIDAFNVILNTANLGSNYETCPGDQMWDQIGSSTMNPFLYVRSKCEQVMNVTGRKCNFLALDRLAWRAFSYAPAVQQTLPVHTTPAGLQLLSIEYFEKKLEDVLEKGATRIMHFRYLKNTRGPVAQSALASALRSGIGANLILGRIDQAATREDISATKQFAFTGNKDLVNGAQLAAVNGVGDDVPVAGDVASAPMSAFTYPIFDKGQRGGTGVRVLTNRVFQVTRSSSLFVSFGVVDKTRADLYGTQLQ